MTKKVLFIINPVAGCKSKQNIPDLIKNTLGQDIEYEIVYWKRADQNIAKLIKKHTDETIQYIAAVGGDGTVNKVATALVNTDKILMIVPLGSGNGISRHLKIPMDTTKAIELIKTGIVTTIDVCKINKRHFFTTSGIGFDAHVSHLFAISPKRGKLSYVKSVLKSYLSYKAKKYTLIIDHKKYKEKAYLITFANANQWGNDAMIAPQASVCDGLIDVVIMTKPTLIQTLILLIRMFNKTIEKSPNIKIIKAKEITIIRKKGKAIHYDGESAKIKKKIKVSILPSALKVVVPETYIEN